MKYVLILIILILILNINIQLGIRNKSIKITFIILKVIKFSIKVKNKGRVKKVSKYKLNITISNAIDIVSESLEFFLNFLNHMSMAVSIKYEVGLTLPENTAMLLGIIYSTLYSLEGMARNFIKKYNGSYDITPSFYKVKNNYSIIINIKFKIIFVLILCAKILIILLKNKIFTKNKGGALSVKSSN